MPTANSQNKGTFEVPIKNPHTIRYVRRVHLTSKFHNRYGGLEPCQRLFLKVTDEVTGRGLGAGLVEGISHDVMVVEVEFFTSFDQSIEGFLVEGVRVRGSWFIEVVDSEVVYEV